MLSFRCAAWQIRDETFDAVHGKDPRIKQLHLPSKQLLSRYMVLVCGKLRSAYQPFFLVSAALPDRESTLAWYSAIWTPLILSCRPFTRVLRYVGSRDTSFRLIGRYPHGLVFRSGSSLSSSATRSLAMKVPKAVVLLLLAVTFAFADHSSKRPRCVPVHIISVRGTNEKPGEGKIGRIAAAIAAEHPGTKRDALEYPARIFPYEKSSAEGIAALTKELATLVKRCSKSQIVLLGYSQGAHVIGDTLCGGGGLRGIGPATKPIPKKVGDHGRPINWKFLCSCC